MSVNQPKTCKPNRGGFKNPRKNGKGQLSKVKRSTTSKVVGAFLVAKLEDFAAWRGTALFFGVVVLF